MKTFIYILLIFIGGYLVYNLLYLLVLLLQKNRPEKPEEMRKSSVTMSSKDSEDFTKVYCALINDSCTAEKLDEDFVIATIKKQTDFIDGRYDCSDFRMQLLFRLYKDCKDKLPLSSKNDIENEILNFKYFLDEPGYDSMCLWSENH